MDPRGGSALAVIHRGEVVVDLREGWRDPARTTPWDAETLVNVYSVGKPVIALAVLMLVERGLIALDDPMTRYWPSFRTGTTIRQVLSHTSGLATFEVPRPADAWADWDLLCADLAAAEPEWPPARFVAEEIAGPYGLDFGFGLGPAAIARCTDLEYDAPDWPVCNTGEPGS